MRVRIKIDLQDFFWRLGECFFRGPQDYLKLFKSKTMIKVS